MKTAQIHPEQQDLFHPVNEAAVAPKSHLAPVPNQPPLENLRTPAEAEVSALLPYQGLLKTFGQMNRGENFRNRFEEESVIVGTKLRSRYGAQTNQVYSQSVNAQANREVKARQHVSQFLGLETLKAEGVFSPSEADDIQEFMYDFYSKQYKGVPNAKKRGNAQARVDNRVKKLKEELGDA